MVECRELAVCRRALREIEVIQYSPQRKLRGHGRPGRVWLSRGNLIDDESSRVNTGGTPVLPF